jgi:hypothetical protein
MTGYKLELGDRAFAAMIYAVKNRVRPLARTDPSPPDAAYIANYDLIQNRLERAYPLVGVETIRFPYGTLEALLDVMILALHTMPKNEGAPRWTSCPQRARFNAQKRKLQAHLRADVVTRMASLTT